MILSDVVHDNDSKKIFVYIFWKNNIWHIIYDNMIYYSKLLEILTLPVNFFTTDCNRLFLNFFQSIEIELKHVAHYTMCSSICILYL